MDAIIWKDWEVFKYRKSNLILTIIIGLFLSFMVNFSALTIKNEDMLDLFNRNFSYMAILLPIYFAYTISQMIFMAEIGEGSIETLLTTHIPIKRILINKTLFVAITSWVLGVLLFFVSMVCSWLFFYHEIIIPQFGVIANLVISILLIFGMYGLLGVGFWVYPKPVTISTLSMLIFICCVIFMNTVPYVIPYVSYTPIVLLVASMIVALIFYLIAGSVNKEKVALARL